MANYDKVLSDIIVEIDAKQATYQQIHKELYGKQDDQARHIYNLLIKLCERIRKEMTSPERK